MHVVATLYKLYFLLDRKGKFDVLDEVGRLVGSIKIVTMHLVCFQSLMAPLNKKEEKRVYRWSNGQPHF